MKQVDGGTEHGVAEASNARASLQELLPYPWRGLRTDLMLHRGPVDRDGQPSWILEDPLRGTHYRLGYTEGQLLYCLITAPTVDEAVKRLYLTTGLRPAPAEILSFVALLQRERLTLSRDEDLSGPGPAEEVKLSVWRQLIRGNVFFRIPLLRPDAFLERTIGKVSVFWSPWFRWTCLVLGLFGLARAFQQLDQYLSTFNYLFTSQGAVAFFLCLALLKTGHEFAHAYATKAMGHHVRGMGVMLIVVWPLFYTDTTDAWKIPDRRRRMLVSGAGVIFETGVAGLALFAWSVLPDGIPRSLAFFLSSTSILSSVLINLNPFMRYDGYYLLMDAWGVDNLRPRAFALTRHWIRRILLDWRGPVPEIHPHHRWLLLYGVLAMIYRVLIGLSIAAAIYYFFFPALGILILIVDIWMFLLRPLVQEIRVVLQRRDLWGTPFRPVLTGLALLTFLVAICTPLPAIRPVPCLFLYRDAVRLEAPEIGQLADALPAEGRLVRKGELLARVINESLEFESRRNTFDLAKIRAAMESLGGGGEQGAYRNWLMAEELRIGAAMEKITQAIATLEVRSPIDGRIMEVNQDLHAGANLARNTWLLTVADPEKREVRAYLHESFVDELKTDRAITATIRFPSPETPPIKAWLREKSAFPARNLPNGALFDIAGGPMVSVAEKWGRRPRDTYFAVSFDTDAAPAWLAHGVPSRAWIQADQPPLALRWIRSLWRVFAARG